MSEDVVQVEISTDATNLAMYLVNQRIEKLAAAYMKETGIPASEACVCSKMCDDGIFRAWIERRPIVAHDFVYENGGSHL